MARLININDALEKLCEFCSCGDYEDCDYRCSEFENISNIPTVDAVEVVHGRWKRTEKYDDESPVQCSNCLMVFSYIDGICYLVEDAKLPHFCPNCGARMDGDTCQ